MSDNTTGYFCVHLDKRQHSTRHPYQAQVRRGGKEVSLGVFATPEEAALCIARSPEGQAAAAERATAEPPLTSEEALQQVQVEGLTLVVANNTTGYLGVGLNQNSKSKPFVARVSCGGKQVYLGCFATAEEAALCVARSPEGKAAVERAAAAALPLMSEEEGKVKAASTIPSGAVLKEDGMVPPMPPDAFIKEEERTVPLMPLDAFVKVEVVVKEEERFEGRLKRQRPD